jgi:hypothetical protein
MEGSERVGVRLERQQFIKNLTLPTKKTPSLTVFVINRIFTMDISDQQEYDFTGYSNDDLFSMRVRLEQEFKRRNIKFSVGDIGETVVIDFFKRTPGLSKLSRAAIGTKNVDALSRDGERYSIKTVRDAKKTGTIYPDPENKDKQLFEYIIVAQLNEKYELIGLYRFSWKDFLEVRCWDRTMNAWYIPVTKKALSKAEVILATDI